MSAAQNAAMAQSALNLINQLITLEASDASDDQSEPGSDASDDVQDVANLRAAQSALLTYIAATNREIGSDDDLEDIAEDAQGSMNQMIRSQLGYVY